jgi:hypothetical protein
MKIFRNINHAEAHAQAIADEHGGMVGIYRRSILGGADHMAAARWRGAKPYFPGGRECWLLVQTVMPRKFGEESGR